MTTQTILFRSLQRKRPVVRFGPTSAMAIAWMVLLAIATIAAPLLTPYGPTQLSSNVLSPPDAAHWLGTDGLGRDVLTGVIYGGRVSLLVGLSAAAAATLIGTLIGAYAGFRGGAFDTFVMRVAEGFQIFPAMILAALVIALIGPALSNVILVIVLLAWPQTARLARNEAMRLKDMDFVNAARCLGHGRVRVLVQEVIPNLLGPVIALGTLIVGEAILLEAGLGFLGLSAQSAMSWGGMLNEGWQVIFIGWWLSVFPGIAIFLTVLSMNFLGDMFARRRER